MALAIGLDLGGTKIAAGVVSPCGTILGRAQLRTRRDTLAEENCAQMAGAARAALAHAGLTAAAVQAVGVGCPGAVDTRAGKLGFCANLPQLNGYPLGQALAQALGLPVLLENDANAAAWAEYRVGSLQGCANAIAITLGTGVGSGVLVNGSLLRGCAGAGGELGHMVIERQGRLCTCGRRGCWEAYASKRGLRETARQAMQAYPQSRMWSMVEAANGHISAKLPFAAMRLGDAAGRAAVEAYLADLAVGLLNCINIFQPAAICLGGGVSNEGQALLRPLREKLRHSIGERDGCATRLCIAALGNDAGMVGAALLAMEQAESQQCRLPG